MALAFAPLPFYLFGFWRLPFLYAGLAIQVIYLTTRGIQLERLPLVGPHDTLTFLSAAIVTYSIAFNRALGKDSAFRMITSIAAAAFTVFALISKQHNAPLPPVLKTVWFELHVVLAFLSYGLFGIGSILGYLFVSGRNPGCEALQYKAILVGYCLFSLSMIFGGVWAYLAWGTYWLWTPKELWTSILWLYYSLYLHARFRQQWAGRPAAVLGILGFGVVLFTYLGVSLLMKSSHAF